MKKMKELKDLEKIGLSEVSKRTHIEVENLLFIINKDFEKLGRVKAIGLIKILEREYKLDLANWREEYEEYYQEHKKEKNDELFIVVKDENKRKKIIYFLIAVVIIAILFLANRFFETLDPLPKVQSPLNTLNSIIKKAKENLKDTKEANQTSAHIELKAEPKKEIEKEIVEKTEANTKAKQAQTPKDSIDTNKSKELSSTQVESVSLENQDTFMMIPNSRIWVGVIYLDDFSRKQYLQEGNITFDASRDQLIMTGHGDLNLKINGETKEFFTQYPLRFLYKDHNISLINRSKYEMLNKGQGW